MTPLRSSPLDIEPWFGIGSNGALEANQSQVNANAELYAGHRLGVGVQESQHGQPWNANLKLYSVRQC